MKTIARTAASHSVKFSPFRNNDGSYWQGDHHAKEIVDENAMAVVADHLCEFLQAQEMEVSCWLLICFDSTFLPPLKGNTEQPSWRGWRSKRKGYHGHYESSREHFTSEY